MTVLRSSDYEFDAPHPSGLVPALQLVAVVLTFLFLTGVVLGAI